MIIDTHPDSQPGGSDPDMDLVVVLETNDPFQLALAKGLLEEAQIPYYGLGQIATLVQSVDPFLNKWIRLQVPRDRAVEARELMATVVEAQPTESA